MFYFIMKFLFRILAPIFLKKLVSKMQKERYKKQKSENFKTHVDGDTEVSYKKDKSVDPGGEYVDFEDLNDK